MMRSFSTKEIKSEKQLGKSRDGKDGSPYYICVKAKWLAIRISLNTIPMSDFISG